MGLLSCIVVGLIAGWLAEKLANRDHGLLTNLVVGVIGAFIGGFLFHTLMGFNYDKGLNLATIFVATIGATLFLWLLGGRTLRA